MEDQRNCDKAPVDQVLYTEPKWTHGFYVNQKHYDVWFLDKSKIKYDSELKDVHYVIICNILQPVLGDLHRILWYVVNFES